MMSLPQWTEGAGRVLGDDYPWIDRAFRLVMGIVAFAMLTWMGVVFVMSMVA